MIRPGPDALPAGMAPGGVVFRAYAVPTGRLLLERRATGDTEPLEVIAELDADDALAALHTFERGVCLVAYDGDSGIRLELPT